MAGVLSRGSFSFLFRQDAGVISRAVWWTGTAALALLLAALTLVWQALSGGAHRSLDTTSLIDARTAFTYLYLVLFAVAVLLIAVCHYNLSAKRFRARGKQAGLAGVLPFAALVTGASHWIEPRVGDGMAFWVTPLIDFLMLVISVWTVLELGVKESTAAAEDA